MIFRINNDENYFLKQHELISLCNVYSVCSLSGSCSVTVMLMKKAAFLP